MVAAAKAADPFGEEAAAMVELWSWVFTTSNGDVRVELIEPATPPVNRV